jgi:hypothetical protein
MGLKPFNVSNLFLLNLKRTFCEKGPQSNLCDPNFHGNEEFENFKYKIVNNYLEVPSL